MTPSEEARKGRDMADLTDALRRARDDRSFAKELLNDPEKYASQYNISENQAKKLRAMQGSISDVVHESSVPPGGIYY